MITPDNSVLYVVVVISMTALTSDIVTFSNHISWECTVDTFNNDMIMVTTTTLMMMNEISLNYCSYQSGPVPSLS